MATFPPFGEEDLIETRKVLTDYGDDTVDSMRNILIANDHVATGELIRSLSYTITYNGADLDIEFSMAEHGEFVERGRRPGKFPPISNISDWARVKGIPQSAVFPIARKIAEVGIRPTPFFSKSIDAGQTQLVNALTVAFTQDTSDYLVRMMSSLGTPGTP
jgi:hypothetical protein